MNTEKQTEIGTNTAIIKIKPEIDFGLIGLNGQINYLMAWADKRVITTDADLSPATDDLSLIAKLKKAVTEKKDGYCKPIKAHLDDVTKVFNEILVKLAQADTTNRQKIKDYQLTVARKAAEIEALNRAKIELAREEAWLSGTGEITIDTTPLEAQAPVSKVEYLVIDAAKIGKVVRAGLRNIPGIRIYSEDTLRVTTRG